MIRINNYEFGLTEQHILGRGAFSIVYLGKNTKNNSEVAIKKIVTSELKPHNLSAIEDETYIMKLIKDNPHPNIVECYDIIQEDTNIYIIMEYCDSGNLESIIRKPIKESYTQFYFSQLANGLKYLYKQNIIHRDIKPKNILLTNGRRVLKIADFGFAKQNKNEELYETICGSPLYMAPEIMSHNFYNKQIDLWSIGMILYQMLYGIHPLKEYDFKSFSELKDRIGLIQVSIPPVNNTNKEVSIECIELLKRLLQKDVKLRITWEEFFEQAWLNKYQYINVNKKTDEYKKQIYSVSLGSLVSDCFKETNSNDSHGKKLDIIPDYLDITTNVIDNTNDDIFEIEMENSNECSNNNLVTVRRVRDRYEIIN